MDCDPGLKHTDDAMRWAKRSAEFGDKEDFHVYRGLLEANWGQSREESCSLIDRTLTSELQAAYSRRVSEQLHPDTGNVLQSFRFGTWQILYVENQMSDPPFLFYSDDPLKSDVITTWSGAAAPFETQDIYEWVNKNAPGIPMNLAQCFAWRVTSDRDL